ncbi:thioredoxin family protein [Edaphocola aurantiacus]|uniref:thioredoxin family protein n=1 Tax=Edaphocola aurantiacus TaxID=2601682 RepID=UPI001C986121|nr:thioredoxin family protein [Edaphocola aurantiacus]
MKLFFTLSTVLLLSASSPAPDQPYIQLTEMAAQSQKRIAVYFSGSDWCANCHQFKKKYLDQSAVQQTLQDHYVYYIADFPQRKKLSKEETAMNEALAEKLNPEGIFPLLVIADDQLNPLATIRNGIAFESALQTLNSNLKAK